MNFDCGSSMTLVRDIITICYGDCKNYVFRNWLRHKELTAVFHLCFVADCQEMEGR